MDSLGPALFGLFLVSFTVSKPVSLYHQLTSSSSESNELSSSEEITVPRTTVQPILQNTMRPDSPSQTSDQPAPPGLAQTIPPGLAQTIPPGLVQNIPPGLAQTTPHPGNTEQKVVELDLNTTGIVNPATAAPDLVAPDIITSNVIARGDNI